MSVPLSQLNGRLTLNENIADNGGCKLAYTAFQKWRENNTEHIRLPLNLTPSQEFFLATGQVWCSFYTPEYAKQALLTAVHANNKYRY